MLGVWGKAVIKRVIKLCFVSLEGVGTRYAVNVGYLTELRTEARKHLHESL